MFGMFLFLRYSVLTPKY